ncbi:hypothetical protein HYD77_02295 [Mycoplasmopsis bovis]|nr:hypothetical protein [Mycoplasmopsis bovis]QQH43599.1 hypothetical protein HYD77_02295 [Mycoplasmopsis bovis]
MEFSLENQSEWKQITTWKIDKLSKSIHYQYLVTIKATENDLAYRKVSITVTVILKFRLDNI